jgi:hypothetical protein
MTRVLITEPGSPGVNIQEQTISVTVSNLSSTSVSNALDVDMSDVQEGAVLAYRMADAMWAATVEPEQILLDGGNF